MNVLLTGATGFVGSHLSQRLEAAGHRVLPVTRNVGEGMYDWSEEGIYDWTEEGLQRGMDYADAVVHLAGEKVFENRWTARHKELVRRSRVATTRRLAELTAERKQPLISASAVCYYGFSDGRELSEEAPAGDDFLARVCVEWEEAAEPAREAGVRVATLRIGVVLGRGGGALAKMLPSFRMGLGGPVGSGEQWVSWIHIDDLASIFLFLLESGEAAGAYNATAPHPVTMQELSETLGGVLRRPAAVPLPAPVLRATLGSEAAEVLLNGQRVLPQRLLEAGFSFRYPRIDEALRELLG